MAPELATARLKLRHWREADLEPYAALNADPRVMRYLAGTRSRDQSDASAAAIFQRLTEQDYGLWAVEVPGVAPFIGFVGLTAPSFEAHFTPCIEIGWRLAYAHWGRGYASEAAGAALLYAFETLRLAEIFSFTATTNERSIAVMQRLGMKRLPEGAFEHPSIPEGHPVRPHVLFRLRHEDRRHSQ